MTTKRKEVKQMETYTVECRTQGGLNVTIRNVLATSEKNATETVRKGFPNLVVGSAVKSKEEGNAKATEI